MSKWYCRTLENNADAFLEQGDLSTAERLLKRADGEYWTKIEAGEDIDDPTRLFSRAAFKLITLPFYDLALNPSTEERRTAGNGVYETVVTELMEPELATRTDKYKRIGRISELVFLCLLARKRIDEDTTTIPLIAPRHDDMFKQTDFYLSPIGTGSVTDGWPIQVKTVAREKDEVTFDGSPITLVGMNHIHPTTDHSHRHSLARSMRREVNDWASDEDIETLDTATEKLYERIINSQQK